MSLILTVTVRNESDAIVVITSLGDSCVVDAEHASHAGAD